MSGLLTLAAASARSAAPSSLPRLGIVVLASKLVCLAHANVHSATAFHRLLFGWGRPKSHCEGAVSVSVGRVVVVCPLLLLLLLPLLLVLLPLLLLLLPLPLPPLHSLLSFFPPPFLFRLLLSPF